MSVIKFETIEIKFDGTPVVRCQQIGAIVGQLRFGQLSHLIIEKLVEAPNAKGVGF